MKRGRATLLDRVIELFRDDDPPGEPVYDPVHLGTTFVVSLAGIGALYWLLWTLLVFEGGLQTKLSAGAQVLFTAKTLADFGYQGSPYAMGAFEGWLGNLIALALTAGLAAALRRLYRDAAKKKPRRK